eukprot:TRINITY_DN4263_c0_g2_i2.p1 TRINITY_DN4263_c0_g2~~TRINITY_DN4263_c0_g2_i2.p1  ORF type:complete len:237 (+),score=43.65 TRINITY_DN4263_c0_g2_i2:225-935(+)
MATSPTYHQAMLGSYSATEEEVNALLQSDPKLAMLGQTLDNERRSNAKLSDDSSTVQRNLKMVHRLLVNERDALQKILEAARQSIREARKKQSAAESELSTVRFTYSSEKELWQQTERELRQRIAQLESDNGDVRRRASQYAEMLLRHKGRLVVNMLRSATLAAITQFYHVWKDYVQDIQTMQAAQELHDMTQGVGGRNSMSAGDDDWESSMEPTFTDLGVEAWDIKSIAAGQFGL